MTTTKATIPPSLASVGDTFVDQSDSDKIYTCHDSYDSKLVQRNLTLTGSSGVDIAFSTVSPHYPSKVEIIRGGASGSATLSRSGDESGYTYTFTLYDDSSSNDVMLSLIAGQPLITAFGFDSAHGDVVEVSPTDMIDTILSDFWTLRSLHCRFVAEPPNIAVGTNLPSYIPPIIRNVLAEAAAVRLAGMDGGGDLNRTRMWNDRIATAVSMARKAKKPKINTKQTRRYF